MNMNIYVNCPEFSHDVQMLVMAFFPGTPLRVVEEEGFFHEEAPDVGRLDVSKAEDGGETFLAFYVGSVMTFEYFEQGSSVDFERQEPASEDRKENRNQAKRMVYDVLSRRLGKTLPWGTLTGIRPVKMLRQSLEAGCTEEDLYEELEREYYLSGSKARLSMEVARTELECLRDVPYRRGYSLYAGIPFCPSRCAYCSFPSHPLKPYENRVEEYVERLCQEMDYTLELLGADRINTIYVGGGTPTTLSPRLLDRLLGHVRTITRSSQIREFTVEAGRPDSIDEEKLRVLLEHGVDRISINPQTMNDETLERIGRRHTVAQTEEAFALARRMGFDNINMDIILGLPGEEERHVERTMDRICALSPDSLTVHTLAIKRAARLNVDRERYEGLLSHNSGALMEYTRRMAQSMGMKPYYLYRQKNMTGNFENVGYARDGKVNLYNILIMEEMQTIAAVGAGGSTKLFVPSENRIHRIENVKDVTTYLDRFDEMLARKREAVEQEKGKLFNA